MIIFLVVGVAGRHFTNLTDKLIPRITGLDPARSVYIIHLMNVSENNLFFFFQISPCFNEGERLNGLQRGDASFVDIIHSNAGILGVKESRGDIDFFPNGYIYQIISIQLKPFIAHKK